MPGIVTQTSAVTVAIFASMGWWRSLPTPIPKPPVPAGGDPDLYNLVPLFAQMDANLTGVDDIVLEPLSQESLTPLEASAHSSRAAELTLPQASRAFEGSVDWPADAPTKIAYSLDLARRWWSTGVGMDVAPFAAAVAVAVVALLVAVVAAATALRRRPTTVREDPRETVSVEAMPAELDRTARCEEYTVTVDLSAGNSWGLGLSTCPMTTSLAVVGVGTGLVREWNLENPRCKVKVGDHVVEVNGFLGFSSMQQMSKELSKKQITKIKFCRMVPKLRTSGMTPPHSPLKAVPQRIDIIDEQISIPVCQSLAALPVEKASAGNWYIKNVYEHQAVKVGLRRLNEIWETLNFTDERPTTPHGKTPYLLKKDLLLSLADGRREMQAVPGVDLSAAQSDLKHLPLQVLLQIRVRCLDMNFNNEIHQAFISILHGNLFAKIGQLAFRQTEHGVGNGRSGQRAVIFFGASTAISSPLHWCWQLDGGKRTFFDASTFTCSDLFPKGGVLEVRDYSKADPNDASGVRRWMDWQVRHVVKEMHLKVDDPKTLAPAGPMEVSAEQLQDSLQRLRHCGDA